MGERVRKNWARSNYKEGLVHHLSEEARVGGNTEHLVLLENTRLRAWRTDQSWIQLITSRHQHLKIINNFFLGLDYVLSSSIDQCRPVPIRVDNPQQTVYQILLCRLAMLFSFFIASLISMSCLSSNQC